MVGVGAGVFATVNTVEFCLTLPNTSTAKPVMFITFPLVLFIVIFCDICAVVPLKENEKLLLFVGRLSPHKNVHTLLKIFDLVNEKSQNVKLLIIGRQTFPGYIKKLKKMANKKVIFRGFVDDKELPYYYAASDLYVTASLWEGFNLPAAEAQACGKKVVAFDIGSHPEVVKKGILVKKDDIKGFANVVIRLLK